jgi:ketosteroid isomerase-like protein
MPSRERVQDLITRVQAGDILGAFEEFYADDVAMQENAGEPTVGKDANRTREEAFVASVAQVHESRAASFVVDGDRSAIQWVLDFTGQDGVRYRMDQLAYQTWRGDRIVHERFFYDSAAVVAGAAA